MQWFRIFYEARLRWFVESMLADLVKGLFALIVLFVFEAALQGLRYFGVAAEKTALLETIDFNMILATVAILAASFVIRLLISCVSQK
jgi:hypothetical protein